MSRNRELILKNIRLGKLVHGGQTISDASDGRKLLIWGGLPSELVNVRITKKKPSYLEGVVTQVIEKSSDRIKPVEPDSYLSTSPWQIMSYSLEKKAKTDILKETFKRAGLNGVIFEDFVSGKNRYKYRNKQEFGFWGDEKGLHLAHYIRGSHDKQIVQGSVLAQDTINGAAISVKNELNRINIWGGKLKTLVLRCSNKKDVVGALFVKEKIDFSSFKLPKKLKGLNVYLSDPKSPASIPTKLLYAYGDIKLMDTIMGKNITYDVLSFFQVNLPVFSVALEKINELTSELKSIDLYGGVGTIGLCLDGTNLLVESEESNITYARINTENTDIKVVHASSEKALSHIEPGITVVVDPPRAGLHHKLVKHLLKVKPQQIVYLSCNPSTQARDVALLTDEFEVVFAQGYNFFPATPHIESLVVMNRIRAL